MKRNFIFLVIGFVYFFGGYILTNHFHFFESGLVPLFNFEKTIPLIPWTGWVYVSDYFYFLAIVLFLKNQKGDKFFISVMILMSLHLIFFIFMPTPYPRSDYLFTYESIIDLPLWIVYMFDSPTNCFPSAHVGFCFLGAFFFLKINKKYFSVFLLWAILIAISTLTTKQHYFLDVISGIVVAVICYLAVFLRKSGVKNECGCSGFK